jgi:hypothetical protein
VATSIRSRGAVVKSPTVGRGVEQGQLAPLPLPATLMPSNGNDRRSPYPVEQPSAMPFATSRYCVSTEEEDSWCTRG